MRRLVGAVAVALVFGSSAQAATPLTRLSTDPFTNTTSQHQTEVEPDSFAFGSTMVAAFQVGRFFDGGGSDIGWATSTDSGASWTSGFLSGITSVAGGGPYERASDPSVAFDARHGVWLIESLGITPGKAVVVSRSTDGGLSWGGPITLATGADLDKNWIVCDNHPASPFYGRCYSQWDDNGNSNRIKMSTSLDGGLSWSTAVETGDQAGGLGGQPVVQPNGNVIVPIANLDGTAIVSFRSVDGGASWESTVVVSPVSRHVVAGGLRTQTLPSAEVDGAGNVYVVWQDCRFRASCSSNDIVMASATQSGYPTWSAVTRIPIDATTSTVDHFIPGLAVDPSTTGANGRLALAYYYYPFANCIAATCALNVGFVSSSDGGASWSAPDQLAGAMALDWLPSTTQGRMVGDYISTSFLGGVARPVFAVANEPTGGVFDEAIYTTATPPPPTVTAPPAGPPTVTLTSVPPSSTTSTSASFSWTTTGSPASTTCSRDGAAAVACSSPASYSGFAVGVHSFSVTVANSAGSASVSYGWTVTASGTGPTVRITSGPRSGAASRVATFRWTATGSPTSTTCTLDGAALGSCSSPRTVTVRRSGSHRFSVTVSNQLGSATASYNWSTTTGVHVIQGDRNAGGIKIGRSTPAQVRRLFGAPSSSRVESAQSCVQSWKGVRLVVTFFTFEGKPCTKGVALIVTVTSRSAWRTAAGLRVGDPVARVRALYPRARFRTGFAGDTGYWLVTRQICAEVGGGSYPGLLARIRAGRVSAFVSRIAVCD